jgi:hypothetical protein
MKTRHFVLAALVCFMACTTVDKRGEAPLSAPAIAGPPALSAGCASDGDCELVEWAGCCNLPCPEDRQAVYKPALARAREVCAVVECVRERHGACGKAPNLLRAQCVNAVCVGVIGG